MDAKSLLNAMIARLVDLSASKIKDREDSRYRNGQYEMTVHAVSVVKGLDPVSANEWLAEELQERICAMAD